ncbi:hypothetical protein FACS1894158_06980 [Betaproteobacteria bacterium]|nr:hypothetical protein FACS1894158_06980 [Betaproteobacteria bacterium]
MLGVPLLRTTIGTFFAVLVSVSFTMPVFAQSKKSASSLSDVRRNIDSPNGKAIYDEQMDGTTRQDGFGTILPDGITAENVVQLLLPKANASLATLVGMKRWPHGKDMYVAFVCIAPSQRTKDDAIKYNNGKPVCDLMMTGYRESGEYLMAVGMLQINTNRHLSLVSTSISWLGIEGSPLGAKWSNSNLFGPVGINHWKDEESEELKSELLFSSAIYRFDFAKYAITDNNIAFGIRSGMGEGYSGGGAEFQILTLFAVIDGELRVIFSEPMYYFKDIAGNWNKNGTRKHEIFEGENTVSVSKTTTNGYFKLIVKSKKNSWHKSFVWNPNTRQYEAEAGKPLRSKGKMPSAK